LAVAWRPAANIIRSKPTFYFKAISLLSHFKLTKSRVATSSSSATFPLLSAFCFLLKIIASASCLQKTSAHRKHQLKTCEISFPRNSTHLNTAGKSLQSAIRNRLTDSVRIWVSNLQSATGNRLTDSVRIWANNLQSAIRIRLKSLGKGALAPSHYEKGALLTPNSGAGAPPTQKIEWYCIRLELQY